MGNSEAAERVLWQRRRERRWWRQPNKPSRRLRRFARKVCSEVPLRKGQGRTSVQGGRQGTL
eukprot:10540431-Alexandrium_andersonii.AAC.1